MDFIQKRKAELLAAGRHTATVCEKEYTVNAGVFSPKIFRSKKALLEAFAGFHEGQAFLEIGTGCGCLAIEAALKGCKPVTATDINPKAVANAKENAVKFGAEVNFVVSDVFDSVPRDQQYDVIFWLHAFYGWIPGSAPDAAEYEQLGMADPDLRGIEKYMRDGRAYLSEKGRIGLSVQKGGTDEEKAERKAKFLSLCEKYKWSPIERSEVKYQSANGNTYSVYLYELEQC